MALPVPPGPGAPIDLEGPGAIAPGAPPAPIVRDVRGKVRPDEEVRGTLAILLVAILAGMILLAFVFLWQRPEQSKELHDLLALVFSPVVALVGAATGYYFGSKSGKSEG